MRIRSLSLRVNVFQADAYQHQKKHCYHCEIFTKQVSQVSDAVGLHLFIYGLQHQLEINIECNSAADYLSVIEYFADGGLEGFFLRVRALGYRITYDRKEYETNLGNFLKITVGEDGPDYRAWVALKVLKEILDEN